jgi:hypothetical protein
MCNLLVAYLYLISTIKRNHFIAHQMQYLKAVSETDHALPLSPELSQLSPTENVGRYLCRLGFPTTRVRLATPE